MREMVLRGMFYAGIAQLVERNLAKVEVASSRLVSRSRIFKKAQPSVWAFLRLGLPPQLRPAVYDPLQPLLLTRQCPMTSQEGTAMVDGVKAPGEIRLTLR